MKKYLRKKFINFLVKHLYKTISVDDLLKADKQGRLYIGSKLLTKESSDRFREEAEKILKSPLWPLLRTEVEYHAVQKVLHKSESMEDVVSGKLMIYILDIISAKLKSLT